MISEDKSPISASTGESSFPHKINRDHGDFSRREFALFASGTGHQLNNLAASLQGRLELIQHYCNDSVLDQHIKKLELTTQKTKELASILVEFNQKHLLQPKVVRCTEIASYLETAIVVTNPTCFLISCHTDASIEVDFRLLTIVLRNIVSNSERSIGRSAGAIELKFSDKLQDTESNSLSMVSISIIDSGPGFTEDELLRASQPYYTTNGFDDAHGLGLTLARFFTLEFDGYINICNVAKGAQVSLVLPITKIHEN